MTVHAHPDDETIGTGGVMAKAVAEGHRVVLVTCTRGELGEIVVPELDTPENHRRLAEIRAGELEAAMAALGVTTWENLGYRDSGMMGTPGNQDPRSFWQADLDDAIRRLVWLVRLHRPDVMTHYNDFGGYGHPDHIRAHQVAIGAFYRAGDPEWHPEQLAPEHGGSGPAAADGGLEPWAPAKLYEQAMLPRAPRGDGRPRGGGRHDLLVVASHRGEPRGAGPLGRVHAPLHGGRRPDHHAHRRARLRRRPLGRRCSPIAPRSRSPTARSWPSGRRPSPSCGARRRSSSAPRACRSGRTCPETDLFAGLGLSRGRADGRARNRNAPPRRRGVRWCSMADPTGFEPAISSVTGWHVGPLHHGSAAGGI